VVVVEVEGDDGAAEANKSAPGSVGPHAHRQSLHPAPPPLLLLLLLRLLRLLLLLPIVVLLVIAGAQGRAPDEEEGDGVRAVCAIRLATVAALRLLPAITRCRLAATAATNAVRARGRVDTHGPTLKGSHILRGRSFSPFEGSELAEAEGCGLGEVGLQGR
jgi:hypothetical protein